MKSVLRKQYIGKLLNYKDLELIKVVTGVRRCGKSTILLQYIDELKKLGVKESQIFYRNFERIDEKEVSDYKTLNKILLEKKIEKEKLYVFLDEIQEIKGFEKAINSLYLDREIDIYITGSNANLLSSEISTLLTGRYIEIKVYPFSFSETLELREKEKNEVFQEYMLYGGMPYALQIEDKEAKIEYLQNLYNTIVLKDIVKRKQIKDVSILEDISSFICDSIGSIVSPKSIADTLSSRGRKVSSITVDNYLTYLCESLLFYKCKRYDIKGKQHLETLNKIYLVDQGFRSFFVNSESNYGHVIENLVYVELLRRGYNVQIGKMYDSEIDFVCEKKGERK